MANSKRARKTDFYSTRFVWLFRFLEGEPNSESHLLPFVDKFSLVMILMLKFLQ